MNLVKVKGKHGIECDTDNNYGSNSWAKLMVQEPSKFNVCSSTSDVNQRRKISHLNETTQLDGEQEISKVDCTIKIWKLTKRLGTIKKNPAKRSCT